MLTKPQIESEQMKDLKYDLKIEKGIIIYTASTMEEQRDIAEYINTYYPTVFGKKRKLKKTPTLVKY